MSNRPESALDRGWETARREENRRKEGEKGSELVRLTRNVFESPSCSRTGFFSNREDFHISSGFAPSSSHLVKLSGKRESSGCPRVEDVLERGPPSFASFRRSFLKVVGMDPTFIHPFDVPEG